MFGIVAQDEVTELREQLAKSDARVAQLEAAVHQLISIEMHSQCPQSRCGGARGTGSVYPPLEPFVTHSDYRGVTTKRGVGDQSK